MRKNNIKGACNLYTKDGMHLLQTPKGERVPMIIWTRVDDSIDCATVICKMHVNLVNESELVTFDDTLIELNGKVTILESEIERLNDRLKIKQSIIDNDGRLEKLNEVLSKHIQSIKTKWWFRLFTFIEGIFTPSKK